MLDISDIHLEKGFSIENNDPEMNDFFDQLKALGITTEEINENQELIQDYLQQYRSQNASSKPPSSVPPPPPPPGGGGANRAKPSSVGSVKRTPPPPPPPPGSKYS